jgi:hypothetical protein
MIESFGIVGLYGLVAVVSFAIGFLCSAICAMARSSDDRMTSGSRRGDA